MATISATIQLYDQISQPINNIIASLNNLSSSFTNAQSQMSNGMSSQSVNTLNNSINNANNNMQQLNNAASRTSSLINNANSSAQNINNTAQQINNTAQTINNNITMNISSQNRMTSAVQATTKASDGLLSVFKRLASVYVSFASIKSVVKVSDEISQIRARLNNMNDGVRDSHELFNMIYASAQDARSSISSMADVVSRFGNNAKAAFSSTEEVVRFANLIQKEMINAGAGTNEAAAAMLQLSQALGSGVLRGDELNSIFEQSPNLIQDIAKYIENNDSLIERMSAAIKKDVADVRGNVMGNIRDMAKEGLLTADIVKAAIFSASDDINAKFSNMPMTWGQVLESFKNTAIMAFEPVLQRINDLANSEDFQTFATQATQALAAAALVTVNVLNSIGQVASWVRSNWESIAPVLKFVLTIMMTYMAVTAAYRAIEAATTAVLIAKTVAQFAYAAATGTTVAATTAATAAQLGLNAAMLASPVTWIILAITAVIAILVALSGRIAKTTDAAQTGLGIVCGALATAGAFIYNTVIAVINNIITAGINIWNLVQNFAAALSIVFNDPIAAIKVAFMSMFNFIVGIVSRAAAMIDTIFGSNLQGAVEGFRGKIQEKIDATVEAAGGTAPNTLNPQDFLLQRKEYGETFKSGAKFGDSIVDKVTTGLDKFNANAAEYIPDTSMYDFSSQGINQPYVLDADNAALKDIAANTSDIKDSVDISNENLKYMRDAAEREAVNRFTTASINVTQTNNNNIASGMDIDGIVSKLSAGINETISTAAEGVY